MTYADKKNPAASYAVVLGEPWNAFGSPPPAKPTEVPANTFVTAGTGLKYAVLEPGDGDLQVFLPGQPVLVDYRLADDAPGEEPRQAVAAVPTA